MDRLTRMVERDKNHPCHNVVLGNESGWGENYDKLIEWLRQRNTAPLIYCERAIQIDQKVDIDVEVCTLKYLGLLRAARHHQNRFLYEYSCHG